MYMHYDFQQNKMVKPYSAEYLVSLISVNSLIHQCMCNYFYHSLSILNHVQRLTRSFKNEPGKITLSTYINFLNVIKNHKLSQDRFVQKLVQILALRL